MRKIVNPLLCILLSCSLTMNAQDTNEDIEWASTWKEVNKALNSSMELLNLKLNEELKDINKDLNEKLEQVNINLDKKTRNKYTTYNSETSVNESANSIEKRKTISKLYSVSTKDKLSISNQYGKVEVNTWDRNEIKVDITIISIRSTEEKAERDLNNITIDASRDDAGIVLKTLIKSTSYSQTSKNGEKSGMEINYIIYMPAFNPLDINNKFGATTIPDFKGPLNIVSKYGNLSTGRLMSSDNTINLQFGDGTIEAIRNGKITASYGTLLVKKAEKLVLNHKFGDVSLTEVDDLTAEIGYSDITINKLNEQANIDVEFSGDFTIDKFGPLFNSLVLDASYSDVHLQFNENANCYFDINMSYGDFKYPGKRISDLKVISDDNTKIKMKYQGKFGSGDRGKISIRSRFGDIKFS